MLNKKFIYFVICIGLREWKFDIKQKLIKIVNCLFFVLKMYIFYLVRDYNMKDIELVYEVYLRKFILYLYGEIDVINMLNV